MENKKMRKKIIGFVIIVIILNIIAFSLNKNRKVIKPNMDYVAIIYHSEMIGIDSGVEYNYYIYPNKKNTYIYVKTVSNITITGLSEQKEISSNNMNNKWDIRKIKTDIKKDKRKGAQQTISYIYIKNGKKEKCNTLKELTKELFK